MEEYPIKEYIQSLTLNTEKNANQSEATKAG